MILAPHVNKDRGSSRSQTGRSMRDARAQRSGLFLSQDRALGLGEGVYWHPSMSRLSASLRSCGLPFDALHLLVGPDTPGPRHGVRLYQARAVWYRTDGADEHRGDAP